MTKENMQTRSQSEEVKIDLRNVTNTIVFLAAFLAVWEVIVLLEVFPAVSLPSPFMVAQSLLDLIEDGTLVNSITITMLRLFVGFLISILIGVGVGLTMMKFKYFGKTLNSFAVGLQSFPSIAWIPFAILLIGLNDSGILFVVIMSSVFSIMISTYSGMRNIPTILVGAEMLITTLVGLGYILAVGREFSNMSQIIAAMIVIFAIGLIFDRIVFSKIEDKIRDRWGLNQQLNL